MKNSSMHKMKKNSIREVKKNRIHKMKKDSIRKVKNRKCDNNIDKNKNKKMAEAGMTVETAFVLPIFLLAIIALFDFFVIINYQNILQHSMNNTARSMGRYAYTINNVSDLESVKSVVDIDSEIISSGITIGYAWNKILSDEVKNYSERSGVYRGVHGISFINSVISSDDKGINDLKADYVINTKFPGRKVRFYLENRCYFRSWIGESIIETGSDSKYGRTVYITRTGKVYHLKSTCSYIKIVTTKAVYKDVETLRNAYGSKYKACSSCISGEMKPGDYIYITSDGRRYHSSEKCSRIKREVTAIDISEVGSRTLCSKCKKG